MRDHIIYLCICVTHQEEMQCQGELNLQGTGMQSEELMQIVSLLDLLPWITK